VMVFSGQRTGTSPFEKTKHLAYPIVLRARSKENRSVFVQYNR
jgi:hypothetical protein